ncbi:MAG: SDR family oxidoreductase [Nitrospira sp.]|nr:SDR family oxidoreductase [Nitrospira sp.]
MHPGRAIHSLIVGGTRGLGLELVRLFSEQGHTVSVIGRRAPGDPERSLQGAHFWTSDLTDERQLGPVLDEVVARNGKLNNLVLLQRFKGNGDPWVGEIATSLTATKISIERLAGDFCHEGDKSIVLVSSIVGRFIAGGQPVSYHVAKATLGHMARYYAVEFGAKGIRVNCVSPCTFIKEENAEFYRSHEELHNLFKRTIPLGRMGTARESAEVIAFLCSPKASFVTGQEILVDGGVSLLSQESLARKLMGL